MKEVTYLKYMNQKQSNKISKANRRLATEFFALKDKKNLCDFALSQNIEIDCEKPLIEIQEKIASFLIEKSFVDIYKNRE